MNRLKRERQAQVVAALVEGNSINAAVCMTGVAKNTILKLLADLGSACEKFQDERLKDLPCVRIQCDEIWSFCHAKQKNVSEEKRGQEGDVWTWTALDADAKLVPSWLVGRRDAEDAYLFMQDLASRLARRVQLTTDGHRTYLNAVDDAFANQIDYAMLVQLYDPAPEGKKRYNPAQCVGMQQHEISGRPDPKHISTSYVERQNLTMRMSMGRFTRLTNGFSKKLANLKHAVALHYMHYNFVRIHKTLRVTPAMEAGIESHVWSIEEILSLLDSN